MVLSLEEGHGLNVTNECCWASKEDVCGDDRVRVVSVISISIYYPYLLSVRVDGSGVNPQASICFKRFGQDTFAEKKRLIALRRMIWLYFVLLIGEGALRKWIVSSLGAPLLVIRDPLVLLIYLQAVRCRRFPSGAVVAYFLLLSSFTLLALFQMIAVGQLDSVRSAKNAQPI
jgi:hypothetical protein